MPPLVVALALLAALAGRAGGDMLILKDGRVIQDKKLQRVEGGIEIAFENGQVLVPQALVEDALIEGEIAPPMSPEEQEQAAKGFVRYEGKWIPAKRRDELIQKRLAEKRKEFQEIAAHREWRNRYKETTKHFAFEYTLPPAVFANYRDLMEAYFTEFVKQWKIKTPPNLKPLPVCLHIDYDAMMQVGGAGWGVLGYFVYVTPWECNFFHDRLDPSFTVEVMFHETNHYLQKLIDLDFSYPHFPGESLAEYYGASHWDPEKKKLTTGLVLEGRLVEVQEDIQGGEWMGLKKLVTTEGDYDHYTWGWSLVHFLMSDPRYKAKFQKFFTSLPDEKGVRYERISKDNLKTCSQEEVWKVLCKHLELKDDKAIAALEKEWHTYVKEKLTVVTAAGLEKAANSASNMYPRQSIKAKRLFKEAIEKGSQNPLTFHRYAALLAEDSSELDQALALWKKAIELDPLNADFYAAMGRALGNKGQKDEAKRLRKLAREIDPDDPWIDLGSDEDR